MAGRKIVITISLDPELLDQVDEICEINGLNRSRWITAIIQEKLDYINTIAEQENEKEREHGC